MFIMPIEKSESAKVDYSKELRKKATDSFQYYQPMIMTIEAKPHEEKLNTLEMIWAVIKWAPKTIRAFLVFVKLMESLKMTQSTLDTIKGILRALAVIAGIFGVNIAPDAVETILTAIAAIWGVMELILGWISNSKIIKLPKGD